METSNKTPSPRDRDNFLAANEALKWPFLRVQDGRLFVQYLEMPVTTRCTLQCRDCIARVPYLPDQKHFTLPFDLFKKDLDSFLACITKLNFFKFIGGEPMFAPDFDAMFEYAVAQKKIVKVNINSNCTILPSERLLSLLVKHKNKSWLTLSNYSHVSPRCKESYDTFIALARKHNIEVSTTDSLPWRDHGKMKQRQRTDRELVLMFRHCFSSRCTSLFDGRLHCCNASGVLERLATKPVLREDEVVQVRGVKPSHLKESLIDFYAGICRRPFTACDYCAGHERRVIDSAIQTDQLLKIEFA